MFNIFKKNKSNNEYSFIDPKNTAVITCKHIIEEGADIRRVTHEENGSGWQFLCGNNHKTSDARVVSLGEIVKMDPSLNEISDLPWGCVVTRKNKSSNWEK